MNADIVAGVQPAVRIVDVGVAPSENDTARWVNPIAREVQVSELGTERLPFFQAAMKNVQSGRLVDLKPALRRPYVEIRINHAERIPREIKSAGAEIDDIAEWPKHHRHRGQLAGLKRNADAASKLVPEYPSLLRLYSHRPVDGEAALPQRIDDLVIGPGFLRALVVECHHIA